MIRRVVAGVVLFACLGWISLADPPLEEPIEAPSSLADRKDTVTIPLLDAEGRLTGVRRRLPDLGRRLYALENPDERAAAILRAAGGAALEGPDVHEELEGRRGVLPPGTAIDEARVQGGSGGFFVTLPEAFLDGLDEVASEALVEAFLMLNGNVPQIRHHVLMVRKPGEARHRALGAYLPARPPVSTKPGEAEARDERTGQPPAGGQGRPAGALSGKSVFLSPGHGWYYSSTLGRWATQRGNTNNIIEDISNGEAVLTYLTEYLWNAGAGVYTCRERDFNVNRVIVDDGDPEVTFTGTWTVDGSSGYQGDCRRAAAAASETATATYVPTIPEDGYYHVSVWYEGDGGTPNATEVRITVRHAGGETTWLQNMQRDGYTWKYIGRYYFYAGTSSSGGAVAISDESSDVGNEVVADAVRFGGGIGEETPFGEAPSPSGWPRWEESGKYHAHYMGCGTGDCGNYTVSAMPRYADWENEAGWEDSVYVSWHTNAPDPGRGTSSFAYTTGDWGDPFSGVDGGLELRDYIHDEIINDIRAAFDPSWNDRGATTANFGEINPSNNDEMPASLHEMAFHDTYLDAVYLQDPVFRMTCARAVCQGIVKFFEWKDGASYTLLPEPPTNLRVANAGGGDIALAWEAPPFDTGDGLYGDAATGYRVYRGTNGYGFGNAVAVTGTSYIDTAAVPGTTYFYRVTATNDGGESFPTETLSARSTTAPAPVLVVSGFDRMDRSLIVVTDDPYSGSDLYRGWVDMMNSYRYTIPHARAIDAYGAAFDSCSNEAVRDGQVSLGNYDAVVWYLGEESTADDTFDATEQSLVQTYLSGGGNLFSCGAEIGWDLVDQGGGASFYNDYLKAGYAGDGSGTHDVTPLAGGIFDGNIPFSFDDNTNGEYDTNWPDRLSASGGSTVNLNYSGGTGDGAGTQYDGLDFKTVTFGFPFETITSEVAREETMEDILDFFGVVPDGGDLISPEAIGNSLMWNEGLGSWEWNAVTLDRQGSPENLDRYEVWLSTDSAVWGSVAGTPTAAENWFVDPSEPVSECWYYRVFAVDAAGNYDGAEVDLIVDNPDAAYAGTWTVGTTASGRWGDDYHWADTGGTGTTTAAYTFRVLERGNYEVSLYYPQGGNRSTESRFTVSHSGGSTLYLVDQTANGGAWLSLGTHWFDPVNDYAVVLDDAEPAGAVVIADAVRWQKVP